MYAFTLCLLDKQSERLTGSAVRPAVNWSAPPHSVTGSGYNLACVCYIDFVLIYFVSVRLQAKAVRLAISHVTSMVYNKTGSSSVCYNENCVGYEAVTEVVGCNATVRGNISPPSSGSKSIQSSTNLTERFCLYLAWLILRPWRWMQYVCSKHLAVSELYTLRYNSEDRLSAVCLWKLYKRNLTSCMTHNTIESIYESAILPTAEHMPD
jgi:hypothetical protein